MMGGGPTMGGGPMMGGSMSHGARPQSAVRRGEDDDVDGPPTSAANMRDKMRLQREKMLEKQRSRAGANNVTASAALAAPTSPGASGPASGQNAGGPTPTLGGLQP